jgi:hypothetical protein
MIRQFQITPHHIHQISGVGPVENSEGWFQSNSMRILAQNASTNGVERASPGQVESPYAHGCCSDPFYPARRLEGGSPRERQQQNTLRMDAVDHQMGNPIGERLGLA